MTTQIFPQTRMRRLRSQGWIRDLIQEHRLHPNDLILPLFIKEGEDEKEPITALPGVFRHTIHSATETIKHASDLGIRAFAIFPVTDKSKKTNDGAEALNPDNLICRSLQSIKKSCPNIGLIADVALDPYTTHGHDGLLKDDKILNDETLNILSKQAVLYAQSGADIIAPSDMMDGRIKAIRDALESKTLTETIILSYAAKFASSFYGPFRDAIETGDLLQGDKKTYQLNPANAAEALRDAAMDISEGADMLMVKPGLPYLDIIQTLKNELKMPTLAYHVSGEYAMLKAAAAQGWIDYDKCLIETILSFKRAGTDAILTYAAMDVATLIKE